METSPKSLLAGGAGGLLVICSVVFQAVLLIGLWFLQIVLSASNQQSGLKGGDNMVRLFVFSVVTFFANAL
ncbi:hypothetical protein, partial [uncultured Pseudomonas sp.]|uniref:hypothetical protein n=1 Tax=uncultured Pseudomonas sp. TaxID=114707 RepID=UPI00258C4BE7